MVCDGGEEPQVFQHAARLAVTSVKFIASGFLPRENRREHTEEALARSQISLYTLETSSDKKFAD